MKKISAIFLILAVFQFSSPVFSNEESTQNYTAGEERIAAMENIIRQQQAEINSKNLELKKVKNSSNINKNTSLQIANIDILNSPAALWLAITILVGVISIFIVKTHKKPELCRCALRRELMLKNRNAVKIPGIA